MGCGAPFTLARDDGQGAPVTRGESPTEAASRAATPIHCDKFSILEVPEEIVETYRGCVDDHKERRSRASRPRRIIREGIWLNRES